MFTREEVTDSASGVNNIVKTSLIFLYATYGITTFNIGMRLLQLSNLKSLLYYLFLVVVLVLLIANVSLNEV
jgi:hypothetical protein